MKYNIFREHFPDSILVYVEEKSKEAKELLIDFLDQKSFSNFLRFTNIETYSNGASMVLLKNYSLSKKWWFCENKFYSIKKSIIEKWAKEGQIESNFESALIAFTIDLRDSLEEIFNSVHISIKSLLNNIFPSLPNTNIKYLFSDYNNVSQISIKIYDVGQGSWSDIKLNGKTRIVYDIGADMYKAQTAVYGLFQSKSVDYASTNPVLILSHWDKDHYHILLTLSKAELQTFSKFICRKAIIGITAQRILNNMFNAIGRRNVFILPPEPAPTPKRAKTKIFPHKKPMDLTYLNLKNNKTDTILVFNSEKGGNSNTNTIVLTIQTSDKAIVLPADSHYDQVSVSLLPYLNYSHKHYLIVPHHGGNAGDYIYNLGPSVSIKDAIVSVGNNRYGHPIQKYIDKLQNQGFNIRRSDFEGDITIQL